MFEATEAKKNTVSAEGQLEKHKFIKIIRTEKPSLKVLFIGNSITLHAPKPDIGWFGDWGMAASCEQNDYVHQTVKMIEDKYGKIDYCIAQLAEWERLYSDGDNVLKKYYIPAAEFKPDIIIVRIGENINRDSNKEINCKPFFDSMIKFFIAPNTKQIIVTDCFWQIEVLDNIFKEVIAENGYTYCKISDLYEDKKTMALGQFEHEGVCMHPSDYGMRMIAERIYRKICQS